MKYAIARIAGLGVLIILVASASAGGPIDVLPHTEQGHHVNDHLVNEQRCITTVDDLVGVVDMFARGSIEADELVIALLNPCTHEVDEWSFDWPPTEVWPTTWPKAPTFYDPDPFNPHGQGRE